MILSKSMTGAMWKSNTKYWRRQTFKNDSLEIVITNMWFDIGDFWLWGWEPHCSTGSWCFPSQKWTFWCRPPKCWLFQSYAQSSVNLSMLSHNSQKKSSGYLCHHHHLTGWWKYWKTWTQTTGSMLRPANCRASITVMHIWIKIIGIMIWQCRW